MYNVEVTNLNASSVDIINTIRANSVGFEDVIPEITDVREIPMVGDIILGNPSLSNQFLHELVNRIALVVVKSKTFNNPLRILKKGFLEYGEVVEEVFIELAKAREFSAERAYQRENKRTLPDVKTAFHAENIRLQYPVSVQYEDLRKAFLSADGVNNLITKIINSLYHAHDYDEYLLYKYLIIKGVNNGYCKNITVTNDMETLTEKIKGVSDKLTFISTEYNNKNVHTNTSKNEQIIIMSADIKAKYSTEVLANAFNMSVVDFTTNLVTIDDFTTFDSERFSEITTLEVLTSTELVRMQRVFAVLVDKEFFQCYDDLFTITENRVEAGLYWNYNLNAWKVLSLSPFSNAVVFSRLVEMNDVSMSVTQKIESDSATIFVLTCKNTDYDTDAYYPNNIHYLPTTETVTNGIAVADNGTVIIPKDAYSHGYTITITVGDEKFTSGNTQLTHSTNEGASFTMTAVQ